MAKGSSARSGIVEVELTAGMRAAMERLLATGFYGRTMESVAERILCLGLRTYMDVQKFQVPQAGNRAAAGADHREYTE